MKSSTGKRHLALLRAINVGGRNLVSMSALCNLCEDLGLADAKTLLQSGNLVFQCAGRSALELERWLETETAKRLKVNVDYIVRQASQWDRIIARNPFIAEAKVDPGHLVVVFLKSAPRKSNVDALRSASCGRESIHCDGKQLYVYYPDGIGRSKLTIPLIERQLGTRGTGRNWNTVKKLKALCG